MTAPSSAPSLSCSTEINAKQRAILRAATQVFLDVGYNRASMDRIAREAGVSKQTIYNNYGNKEALFGAMINQRCGELLGLLFDSEQTGADVRATLTRFATTLLDILLEPAALALHRLIIAESGHHPRIGEIYFESGPGRGNQRLAVYLESLCRKGILRIDDPELAAQQFTGALIGALRTQALTLNRPIPGATVDKVVAYTVEAFLAHHGV